MLTVGGLPGLEIGGGGQSREGGTATAFSAARCCMDKRVTWTCPWCPIQNPHKAATAITMSIFRKMRKPRSTNPNPDQEGRWRSFADCCHQ